MIDEHPIRTRFQAVGPQFDERFRRLHAAAEAVSAGYGGVAAASRATKVARSTIGRGIMDHRDPGSLSGNVRRKGAGRPAIAVKDATLLSDLQRLFDPATMGDPERPLRWVSKSHKKLILEEPTAALGFKEETHVLRIVMESRKRGLAAILITHNVLHAMTVGDHFWGSGQGRPGSRFPLGRKNPRGDR